ncbi:hypothetical protein CDAR_468701 [Caerostris darwini]|uniref:Uncharacterized protein n=1 Tax=Caerostris darwini TaxID=1538125 RepID=A0AAV4T9Z1_9ARAC|nr:hypothetical protein CDAR_468701 [Caerostris darwini]
MRQLKIPFLHLPPQTHCQVLPMDSQLSHLEMIVLIGDVILVQSGYLVVKSGSVRIIASRCLLYCIHILPPPIRMSPNETVEKSHFSSCLFESIGKFDKWISRMSHLETTFLIGGGRIVHSGHQVVQSRQPPSYETVEESPLSCKV